MKKAILTLIISTLIFLPFANIFAYSTNNRYENKPFDINTQLYDFNARQYNPNIGQFTQSDTYLEELLLKGAGGNNTKLQELLANPQKLNQRSFEDNNPINYTDPTGKQAELIIPAIPYIFEGATLALGSWFTWEAGQSAGYALENDTFKSQLHANNSFFILGLVGAVADVALVALDLFAPAVTKLTQKINNKAINQEIQTANNLPKEVEDILKYIDENPGKTAMQGYKGGRIFNNLDKTTNKLLLPEQLNGYYKEWDLYPNLNNAERGSQRIVTGQNGEAWYTNDHYETIIKIRD